MDDLKTWIAEARALEHLPEASVEAYVRNKDSLLSRVNRTIQHHPEIDKFLGSNNYQILEINHRNHVSFMAEMFRLNDFENMVRTLPWVYRAYHNQGIDYGYFLAELEAWMLAICKTIDSEKAAPILKVYDWILSHHDTLVELSQQENSPDMVVGADYKPLFQVFLDSMMASDHRHCLDICRQAREMGMGLPHVFHDIVYPAMVEVGLQWEHGDIDVAKEHEATAVANSVLSALYYDEDLPETKIGTAVVSAAPSERHEMGAWMTSICLELDGWNVVYLGSDLPMEDIVAAVFDNKADLLALSVAMPFNLDSVRKLIHRLKSAGNPHGTKIMVGGQVFNRYPNLEKTVDVDRCLSSCIEAVEWARSIATGRQSRRAAD